MRFIGSEIVFRRCVLGAVVALCVATTMACLGASTLPVGEEAPNFGIKFKDKVKTLEGYRDHVVVVVFWSST